MKLTVSILGAGESGVGAALLAKAKGFNVFLSDRGEIADRYCQILNENEIEFESEKHTLEKLTEANLVIKSPGIPGHISIIQEIKKQGIPVISEIEFASRYTNAKIIAITGTNGKTTTTLLTYHLLKESGFNVGVGGNLGNSFAAMVVEDQFDYYVLEISSFQLEDVETFHPQIGLILNITPDHLDRYQYQMEAYAKAKFQMTRHQTSDEVLILHREDEWVVKTWKETEIEARIQTFGCGQEGDVMVGRRCLRFADNSEVELGKVQLLGPHNELNIAAALLATSAFGLELPEVQKGLNSFQPIPHRLEPVGEIQGVRYINDSKATNVDAVRYALQAMDADVVWIAGGVDKGNDYSIHQELVKDRVQQIIAIGKDNE